MRKKRNISLAIALTLVFAALCGCAQPPGETGKTYQPVEYYTAYFDAIGGSDVMPIGGYYGPYVTGLASINGQPAPEYIDDELFRLIAECGINLITKTDDQYGSANAAIIKALELGEKYGIGYFATEKSVFDYFYHQTAPYTLDRETTLRALDILRSYPAFAGMCVIDEPTADKFERVGVAQELYYELDIPGTHTYINLYPSYATPGQLAGSAEVTDYREHLEQFVEKCSPRYISYDHYVFDSGRTRKAYFENMTLVREIANANKIPFWTFVEAGPALSAKIPPYFPDEPQLLWNVNTSLAYGAKGIQYYPLIQAVNLNNVLTTDYTSDGIIGYDGNLNQWYFYAKKANAQILASDHILMNSANLGIIVYGDSATADTAGCDVISEKAFRQFKGLTGGEAMIGCFDYFGSTVLYLVNYSFKNAAEYTLSFSGDCSFEVIRRAKSADLWGNSLKIKLDAGEGALIRLK